MVEHDLVVGKACPTCGKVHKTSVKEIIVKKNVIDDIGALAKKYGGSRAFVVADVNTYPLGGEKIIENLSAAGIEASKYVFADERLEPDEKAVGSLMMHYEQKSDIIIALGSGVINDICKILATLTKNPYIIVATASSMDGYASGTSSMARDGLKVSLNTKSPDVIVADPDILVTAPDIMVKSGLGDMLAKYVSICEWRLAKLLIGEDYCEDIAEYIRKERDACVEAAKNLDAEATATVFMGLVNAGMAMDYAGCSRPCSGGEHYCSHLWDMRGLEFGTPTSFHGIQTAIGTLYCLKGYEMLKKITPNKEKALAYVKNFDVAAWSEKLTEFLGSAAKPMIELEKKEGKYDVEKHRARLEIIIDKWDDILKIIDEELPSSEEIECLLDYVGAPMTVEDIGLEKSIVPMTFMAAKDIRDKYVLARLLWDIGELESVAEKIAE